MTITNVKWTSALQNIISATISGVETCIPVDPRNRQYAEIIAQGIVIAANNALSTQTVLTGAKP